MLICYVGRGEVGAENWRVKEFKRRGQKKTTENKKRLSYKINSRSPVSGGCYVRGGDESEGVDKFGE